ncbi:hypothetical protein IEQ34_001252 [Dendrobium chrysotoxum]|uniref:Uncharacterized protein n=1 Tax=Dendrobium chrysotoxum TaxID=161865 RepID=A0AAV7H789_DENCH|nr:hypothetical protein IEQ34_001252 [Dendrobium chrysotoxum]
MARKTFNAQAHSLCLLVLVIVDAAAARGDVVSANASGEAMAQREFDYFALALQWPGSYCQRTRHCCSSSACCQSNPLAEFTIHGLWPDYNDGHYPSCCRDSDFSIKKISSLMPELQKHWPSLSCGSPSLCHGGKGIRQIFLYLNRNLLRSQFPDEKKHGTCSYPVILDEYSYFSVALDLYFKYNITKILSNEGILASNAETYSVEDIISAIKKAVGALPLLECRRGNGLNGDASSAISWLIVNEPFAPFNVL